MSDETVTPLDRLALPWGKEVEIEAVHHASGLRLLRLRFREGRRFTIVELDPASAERLGGLMAGWAQGG